MRHRELGGHQPSANFGVLPSLVAFDRCHVPAPSATSAGLCQLPKRLLAGASALPRRPPRDGGQWAFSDDRAGGAVGLKAEDSAARISQVGVEAGGTAFNGDAGP